MTAQPSSIDLSVALADRYDLDRGRVYVTGAQAIIRMMLMQHARDRAAGHNTAGYVSGYRGSPVGGLDMQFERAGPELEAANILFQPGLNEDIAATAMSGTQQAGLYGEGRYDGVIGLWYAKGPGVDRSGDALRHANLMGTSPLGGVVALAGDDHIAESSTTAHQSEFAFADAMMPVLTPSGLQDVVDFGLYGYALSRYSGAFVGLKAVKDTIEVTGNIDGDPRRLAIAIPNDFAMPDGGLGPRPGDTVLAGEARLHDFKIPAALAFARANGLDRTVWRGGARPRIGIATLGKSYLDVRQALDLLGIDEARAADLGLRLYKVAMAWPLEPTSARAFAEGLDLVIVVEEKRSLIETQLREHLYGLSNAPQMIGKRDEAGEVLFPSRGALDANMIALAIGQRVAQMLPGAGLEARLAELEQIAAGAEARPGARARLPYFCAGCPHNTSTVVPEGSRAIAGIGCHYMAKWMDRETVGVTQMGGEGANWIGEAPFSTRPHIFANIGDGTYNHSGVLAIRAAVYSGVTMTYKLLFNDAVALTGGQANDGGLDVPSIAAQLAGEGVARIVIVTDDPGKYPPGTQFPHATAIEPREELARVQQELTHVKGVSVLIYDQTCAAEKRRRRKRGTYPDPARRVIINELVCEGCGDCGAVSNCVAIEPVETQFGRKRAINQSVCNKDFSCLNGFCPSFVTIEGGTLRAPAASRKPAVSSAQTGDDIALPDPAIRPSGEVWSMVAAGIGGTGVITIGSLIAMAAHLEGKACGVLDMTGLAQKNGAVTSHIRIADEPDDISAIRVAHGGADLVLGCDLVTAAARPMLSLMREGKTHAVVNTHLTMTADFTRKPDLSINCDLLERQIASSTGEHNASFIDGTGLAVALMGDAIAANLLMLGMASQQGLLPVSPDAIARAIELNGVAVQMNLDAFSWGRRAAADRARVQEIAGISTPAYETTTHDLPGLDQVIGTRADYLTDYQDQRLATRYRALIDATRKAETAAKPGSETFTDAVARGYFKLLAYKDEYEVARLLTDRAFTAQIDTAFSGDFKLVHHLAPPILAPRDELTGQPKKRAFGPWIMPAMRMLATFKFLRGTKLDPFGYLAERKLERRMIGNYEALIGDLTAGLDAENIELAAEIARLPLEARGFGHVKAANVARIKAREAELMAAFNRAPGAAAAQPMTAA